MQYLTVKPPVIKQQNYLPSFHGRKSSLESIWHFTFYLLVFPSELGLDNLFSRQEILSGHDGGCLQLSQQRSVRLCAAVSSACSQRIIPTPFTPTAFYFLVVVIVIPSCENLSTGGNMLSGRAATKVSERWAGRSQDYLGELWQCHHSSAGGCSIHLAVFTSPCFQEGAKIQR